MEPPPWSPERTACAAAVAPWLTAPPRFMRAAQAGGADDAESAAEEAPEDEASLAGSGMPATGDWPPVAVHAAARPEVRLERRDSAARDAACFTGWAAAPAPAFATPLKPAAIAPIPVCPEVDAARP